jgi:hypothetical protein
MCTGKANHTRNACLVSEINILASNMKMAVQITDIPYTTFQRKVWTAWVSYHKQNKRINTF